MNRAFAFLAGLLLVSQVAAQPVAAAAPDTIRTPTVHQRERGKDQSPPAQPNPLIPLGADNLQADGADLRVEVLLSYLVGDEWHTLFHITNQGGAMAHNVKLNATTTYKTNEGILGKVKDDHFIGDFLPKQVEQYTVVCTESATFHCVSNALTATTESNDKSLKNNTATDEL